MPDQHHQAEVGGIVGPRQRRRPRPASSRYFRAGLVAVVAVGDEDRPGAISPWTAVCVCGSVTTQSRFSTPRWSVASSGVRSRRPASTARSTSPPGVGIEPEDRAEVEPGGLVEGQPVGLRARRGSARAGRSSPGRTARAGPGPGSPCACASGPRPRTSARRRRARAGLPRGGSPCRSQSWRKPAARVYRFSASDVAGLVPVQLQPDDVVRAGLVEPVLQGRVDHVIGRRHHVGQAPRPGRRRSGPRGTGARRASWIHP